jgi:hypothetical protein
VVRRRVLEVAGRAKWMPAPAAGCQVVESAGHGDRHPEDRCREVDTETVSVNSLLTDSQQDMQSHEEHGLLYQ